MRTWITRCIYLFFYSSSFFFFSYCQNTYSPTKQSETWQEALGELGLVEKPFDLFLRVFKQEDVIEVWVKAKDQETYTHLRDYPVCRKSGSLGPKRREGDRQVPEGFYHIDRFNPNSSYHLSLGINYPNASDKIRGDQDAPGSDIFIHGACVTIGCLPITDPLIEELYSLAEMAKGYGGQIPVHIFPFRMAGEWPEGFADQEAFWRELEVGYGFFEEKRRLPKSKVDHLGRYTW